MASSSRDSGKDTCGTPATRCGYHSTFCLADNQTLMDARSQIAARVHDIAPFHVMEVQSAARALEAAGRSIIHLEIGEPDFPTPEPVLVAARAGIAGGAVYYTSALGLPELRRAIATHYHTQYGVRVAPERIVVTAGSSAALLLTLALLVDRDEQILLADPGY